MFAALLAEKGYTGPEHVIDGKEGLVHCFGPEWKQNLLTDGLGERWETLRVGFKPYSTNGSCHPTIDLLLELHKTGTTLVVITHDPNVAARMPARVRVADGRIQRIEGLQL